MKKYIIVAVMALGLAASYGFITNQKMGDKCSCNQTEVCACATDACECSSCGN